MGIRDVLPRGRRNASPTISTEGRADSPGVVRIGEVLLRQSLRQPVRLTVACGQPGRGSGCPVDSHSLPRLRFAYPLHKGGFWCGANRSRPINTNLKKGGAVRSAWCGCGGGAGENRGKLFRNKRKMSESVLRSVAGCATMIAGKKERGAWRWNRIDAPGV